MLEQSTLELCQNSTIETQRQSGELHILRFEPLLKMTLFRIASWHFQSLCQRERWIERNKGKLPVQTHDAVPFCFALLCSAESCAKFKEERWTQKTGCETQGGGDSLNRLIQVGGNETWASHLSVLWKRDNFRASVRTNGSGSQVAQSPKIPLTFSCSGGALSS